MKIKQSNLDYCYSAQFLAGTSGVKIRKTLLNDIEMYFGYYSVIQERNMRCYVLRVVDKVKARRLFDSLATNKVSWVRGMGGMLVEITPINALSLLTSDLPGVKSKLYNATRTFNINLKIDTMTTDLEAIRKSIAEYGLDIVKEIRPSKVLVIRER